MGRMRMMIYSYPRRFLKVTSRGPWIGVFPWKREVVMRRAIFS
jgi:hypothetical protein